jgi:hypothetical protein
MADDYKQTANGQDEADELDRALDAALVKYAAVEPRAGLEERILASLRAEPTRDSRHMWLRWSLATALALAVVIAVALGWRSAKPGQQRIAKHPPAVQPSSKLPPPILAANAPKNGHILAPHRRIAHTSQPALVAAAAANPKLDVFPSPQPLSEQEKMALDYVREFPEEATLMARAQTNLARREELEKMQPAAPSPSIQNQE